jgi:hypothetical protein
MYLACMFWTVRYMGKVHKSRKVEVLDFPLMVSSLIRSARWEAKGEEVKEETQIRKVEISRSGTDRTDRPRTEPP